MPPEVVTWTDPAALALFRDDILALRREADVVIASHHWGLDHEVLDYQVEIAHTAIDVGADLNAQNETVPRPIAAEQAELDHIRHLSTRFSTALEVEGDEVVAWQKP
jgi:hypothetical protein